MNKNDSRVLGTEAPDYADIALKKNRPYRKRAALTAIIAATFLIYAIFSTGGEDLGHGGKSGQTNYTPALNSANAQIENRQRESLVLASASDELGEPYVLEQNDDDKVELNAPDDKADGDYPKPARNGSKEEYLREEFALRREWVERQREAFLSKPDVTGEWTAKRNQAVPTGVAETQRNPASAPSRLERLQTQRAQADAGTPAERFFNAPEKSGYLNTTRRKAISPYVLPSGTIIQASLVSGINSDLPGNVTAMVTTNVYDWADPRVCLIPQGTRLFGIYDSNINFAQKRIQVKWSRLIYPDGSAIDLGGMAGTDKQGYGGLQDKFYGHYGRMITAAVLTTAFGIVPELIASNNSSSGTYISVGGQTVYIPETDDDIRDAGESVADALGEIGGKYFDKALNVKPTVLVRPGTRFNVVVDKDIPFFEAWGEGGR